MGKGRGCFRSLNSVISCSHVALYFGTSFSAWRIQRAALMLQQLAHHCVPCSLIRVLQASALFELVLLFRYCSCCFKYYCCAMWKRYLIFKVKSRDTSIIWNAHNSQLDSYNAAECCEQKHQLHFAVPYCTQDTDSLGSITNGHGL
jgi:hypothetical protein